MPGAHGRKRARTADRDRAVEAITLAYVDGQIDSTDRDERVSRALTSTTVGELHAVVADLQVSGELSLPEEAPGSHRGTPVTRRTGRPRSWRESRESFRQMSRLEKVVVVTAVVVVPAGLLAPLLVGGGGGESGSDRQPDLHSSAGIERLVEDVRAEFGTTEVLELELNETWARVYVAEEDGRFRYYSYGTSPDSDAEGAVGFYDSGAGGTTEDEAPDLVDLADLDAERLAANIDRARDELGVTGDVEVAVIVADERMATDFGTQEPYVMGEEDAPPHVEVEVRNEYAETATLTTDLTGVRYLARDPLE